MSQFPLSCMVRIQRALDNGTLPAFTMLQCVVSHAETCERAKSEGKLDCTCQPDVQVTLPGGHSVLLDENGEAIGRRVLQ